MVAPVGIPTNFCFLSSLHHFGKLLEHQLDVLLSSTRFLTNIGHIVFT